MRAPPILLGFLFFAGCSSTTKTQAPIAAPAPKPAETVTVIDEGALKISGAGKPIGLEEFRIVRNPDGQREMTAHSRWKVGGEDVDVSSSLVVDDTFRPVRGAIHHMAKGPAGEKKTVMTLRQQGGVLEVQSEGSPKPFREQGEEKSQLFFHERVLSHLWPLCSLGSDELKEVRVFPGVPFKLGPKKVMEHTAPGGKPQSLAYHVVAVPPASTFEIVCDGLKLVLVRQDNTRLLAVRAGFESLGEEIANAEDRKPQLPAGLQEAYRKVALPDRITLGCSVVMPGERRSPLPSVVLLNGSGPHDRDGDSPDRRPIAVALQKHLAIVLALSGIASFRCDDRGVGASGGSMAKTTLESLAADAAAQVAQLRDEPGIDPDRIGIVGHSEGATVAALVAARDKRIKALILLAPSVRRPDQVSIEQRDAALKEEGASDADRAKERKRLERIYAAIRAGKPLPSDVTAEEKQALEPIQAYLASHLRHDAEKTMKSLKIPVMAMHGDKDFELSQKDFQQTMQVLKKGGKAVEKTYPALGHLFTPTKLGTSDDYRNPELVPDLAFLGDVVKFLEEKL